MICDGLLFKREWWTVILPYRVVGLSDEWTWIIMKMHDEIRHLDQKATYNQIAQRYQWNEMYTNIVKWMKICDESKESKSLICWAVTSNMVDYCSEEGGIKCDLYAMRRKRWIYRDNIRWSQWLYWRVAASSGPIHWTL